MLGPSADFFVWRKAQTDGPVLDFRVLQQVFGKSYQFGIPALVVPAQQGVAGSGDDGLPLVLLQVREDGRIKIEFSVAQLDLAFPVVVLGDLRLDVFRIEVCRVAVSQKAHHWHVPVNVGRDFGNDRARLFVVVDVAEAQFFQLLHDDHLVVDFPLG